MGKQDRLSVMEINLDHLSTETLNWLDAAAYSTSEYMKAYTLRPPPPSALARNFIFGLHDGWVIPHSSFPVYPEDLSSLCTGAVARNCKWVLLAAHAPRATPRVSSFYTIHPAQLALRTHVWLREAGVKNMDWHGRRKLDYLKGNLPPDRTSPRVTTIGIHAWLMWLKTPWEIEWPTDLAAAIAYFGRDPDQPSINWLAVTPYAPITPSLPVYDKDYPMGYT